ncbi:hypothetical protein [Paraburkholderia oxyphila]|uniref:hypothetical protein n=1 Tax=Paraburkholderia oxyphila TaxID=614212 RepID=UPI00047F793E|nr:hypothetical protein [Paraburkholderia oxyphila]
MNRSTRVLLLAIMIALMLLIAAFNWINLSEAYGSGPPYYSRTTNMDKWTNPLPVLAVVDVFAVLAIALLALWIRRAGRN